jgi:hypothetical protein
MDGNEGKNNSDILLQNDANPQPLGLPLLAALIFVIFSIHALFHEYIFQHLPGFHFPLYATFIQFAIQGACAGIPVCLAGAPRRSAPLIVFALVGALSVTAMLCSNLSLSHLNELSHQLDVQKLQTHSRHDGWRMHG